MARPVFMLLFLVPVFFTSTKGKVRDWPSDWSWSQPQLSDDEIVELLYKDPDRLKELTSADYDHHEGFDVSQDIAIPGLRTSKKPNSQHRLEDPFSRPDTFSRAENSFGRPGNTFSRPGVAYSRAENTFVRPSKAPIRQEISYSRPENTQGRPQSAFSRPESPYSRPENPYTRPENPYNRAENSYIRPEKPYTRLENPYKKPEYDYDRPDDYRQPYSPPTPGYQAGAPITLRSPPLARRLPGKATSYTSVHHFSPKKGKPGPAQNLFAYDQHIIHG